ncbi:hypothetical protein V8D89_016331, partial [Ganoderma adspersum]
VWRCWHVWGGEWRVCVVPILLIIASAVCGFAQAIIFAEAKTVHSAFANELERWNGSLFSLSLVTNVVVTTLIAARIWFITRESEITLYFIGSNAFYIVYDPIAQLTGIVPTMIIVMSALGLTSADFESAAASRRDRQTTQMTTMRFQGKSTQVMSLPGLTTDSSTSASSRSYPTRSDESRSVLAIGKDSELKLPEIITEPLRV